MRCRKIYTRRGWNQSDAEFKAAKARQRAWAMLKREQQAAAKTDKPAT